MTEAVVINQLPSGVPGLDVVLGGGIPEFSFTLIAGSPGCGKTTLAHQIMFATATPQRTALYITILGEPPLKMLRYQQQFAFFDAEKLSTCVRFLHLGSELIEGGLGKVLERVVQEVTAMQPSMVFVDSFRAAVAKSEEPGQMGLHDFVQRLSVYLTGWEATTFLVGEYDESEMGHNPLFTVADAIVWLSQERSRNSMVRQAKVVKMRGQAQLPGLHTMKISSAGVKIYPRLMSKDIVRDLVDTTARRGTGVAALDSMLGGGLPIGYSMLVAGPSGSGKTVLASQFVREGLARGETAVIAVFEQRPEAFLSRTPHGPALRIGTEANRLKLLDMRPVDLSIDETMETLALAVDKLGATRVVIDSLSGFELALAPAFREDFREAAYRMIAELVNLGVSVLMTAEVIDSYTELRLAPHGISFLTDGLILQRFVEIDGVMRKILAVTKMRGLEHSHEVRLYDIDETGIVVRDRPTGYEGILTGAPRARSEVALRENS